MKRSLKTLAPPSSPHPRRSFAWWQVGVLFLGAGAGYSILAFAAQPESTLPNPVRIVADAVGAVVPALAPVDDDTSPKKAKKKPDKGDSRSSEFFFSEQGPIPTFIFQLEPEEWEYLKKEPHRYAEATLWEKGSARVWKDVAVKCKGTAGSYQVPEARPALTISMKKYQGAERWHGFQRWHLNNGAQDDSLLNEQISCEMARAAGVPASRCSHALVKWQGRDLGLYLFKEAFDRDFLAKFYRDPDGDLYDGGNVSDLTPVMEKDNGDPYSRENIKELIAAAQEKDLPKRWERLEKILNVDGFLSYLAIESLTCHWDGYDFNRNNYRVYFDKGSGKADFFLHGTDQTFGDANAPAVRDPGSMVGQAVMSNPAWKKAYRERVEKIYNEVLKPIDWPARVTEIGEKVKVALAAVNPEQAKQYDGKINGARARVANRIAAVGKQLGDLPKPVAFKLNEPLALGKEGWRAEGSAAAIDNSAKDGKESLHIRTEGESVASWRRTLALEGGKYRLSARISTAGVVGTNTPSGTGAGLRISGGTRMAPNAAVGDTGWQELTFEFETNGGDIVLVAELRASKGEAWFDRESLQLRRLP